MKITITDKHLDIARNLMDKLRLAYARSEECLVAQALKDNNPGKYVYCGVRTATVGDDRYRISRTGQRIIRMFDENKYIKLPITVIFRRINDNETEL